MVILVGADRLGNIEDLLKQRGFSTFKHITGRHPKSQKSIPTSTAGAELMILFTDFVGHNVMRNFRKQAKEQKIPFIACKRSVCELKQCLDKSGIKSDQVCNSCWSCTRTTH
jgi:hypothetical protein